MSQKSPVFVWNVPISLNLCAQTPTTLPYLPLLKVLVGLLNRHTNLLPKFSNVPRPDMLTVTWDYILRMLKNMFVRTYLEQLQGRCRGTYPPKEVNRNLVFLYWIDYVEIAKRNRSTVVQVAREELQFS